jgi:hypothetical protein
MAHPEARMTHPEAKMKHFWARISRFCENRRHLKIPIVLNTLLNRECLLVGNRKFPTLKIL